MIFVYWVVLSIGKVRKRHYVQSHPPIIKEEKRFLPSKGWRGKAIEHYKNFLDFCEDAKPGIPEIEEALKRLAGLKGQ